MPKMKTRKCVAKRFRLTANGHVKRKCAYRSHLMYRKTTKQKRGLRKTALVDGTQERQIRSMLN